MPYPHGRKLSLLPITAIVIFALVLTACAITFPPLFYRWGYEAGRADGAYIARVLP